MLCKEVLPNWRRNTNHRDWGKLPYSQTGDKGTAKPKTHKTSRLCPEKSERRVWYPFCFEQETCSIKQVNVFCWVGAVFFPWLCAAGMFIFARVAWLLQSYLKWFMGLTDVWYSWMCPWLSQKSGQCCHSPLPKLSLYWLQKALWQYSVMANYPAYLWYLLYSGLEQLKRERIGAKTYQWKL